MIAIQATAPPAFNSIHFYTPPSQLRGAAQATDRSPELPRKRPARPQRGWLEDLFSVAALCVLAGAMLAVTFAMARSVLYEFARYNSFELMRIAQGG